MWTEWLFQAEQGGSRLPDYMAPPVWNIQRCSKQEEADYELTDNCHNEAVAFLFDKYLEDYLNRY